MQFPITGCAGPAAFPGDLEGPPPSRRGTRCVIERISVSPFFVVQDRSRTCVDQRFAFGSAPRFLDTPQFGNICSIEYVIKAGLCRRLCRSVNMIASKNPVKAPRTDSVIERLLKVRRPWPVRINPAYAIATVQTIARAFTAHPSENFQHCNQNARGRGRCLKGGKRLSRDCVADAM